jgi:hypothetical protein
VGDVEMRLWLNGVEITSATSYRVPAEAVIPEGRWRACAVNPPPKWLREHPDLAELDLMLDGYYGPG